MSAGIEEWAVPVGLGVATIAGLVGNYLVKRHKNDRPVAWGAEVIDAETAAAGSRKKVNATITALGKPAKPASTL